MTRPYVILNAAMTLDGKIATTGGDSKISCKKDLDRLHRLRSEVDAVMVGVGTVLADDPSLTVRRVHGKNPIRVIVDGEAKTPQHAKVLDGSAPTILAVSSRARKEKIRKLRSSGAKIVVMGGVKVDLPKFMKELYSMGIRKLLLEGGSTLNWEMLKNGLVDEVRVTIAPWIVGGKKARSLVEGLGFPKVRNGIRVRLTKVERVGTDLLLAYKVVGVRDAQKTR
ncbi:MAG: 2,5-diamino-6-(ribosylamino)-4(3H)-pyrimidinone 5'-phosphate reductase [Hadesarchaea archaeon]|nr:MAG: 2,5-diamino-6-(ribosylamino)-4(3H)-pyrimidinone 5'-phosphate reductase [Hadesarchaea archaeon]